MIGLDEDFIVHRPRKKRRKYYFGLSGSTHRTTALLIICAFAFIFSAVELSTYILDYLTSRSMSESMRNIYHAEQYSCAATPLPSSPPAPTSASSPTSVPSSHSPSPSATPQTRLEEIPYPNNPYRTISTHFAKIRRQNNDIIGWLTIDGLLDEAVVQRDNDYYLHRDYRGYHNANGAIFLEQTCDLSTRPYTYLLYGHNMKSGLMFGSLRNYEDITFYRNNPFITFDTIYENGRYVIFSVTTISVDPTHSRFVNLTKLHSSLITYRQKELDTLLLLITCVDDESDRRVIAARRIRDDETEESLKRMIQKTRIR